MDLGRPCYQAWVPADYSAQDIGEGDYFPEGLIHAPLLEGKWP
jgi:hypothetical protein